MTGDRDLRLVDLTSINDGSTVFFFFFVVVSTVLESFNGSVGDNSATERERDDLILFSDVFSFAAKSKKNIA
jgi:hypothetical protein